MTDNGESKLWEIVESVAEPLLTPAEVEAVLTRPDRGISPAPMRSFTSVEEFRLGSNNFHLRFTGVKDDPDGYLARRTKAHQRFSVISPDLDRSLRERFMGTSRPSADDAVAWESLYEAYQQIAALVDINDRYVVKDGVIDEYSLLR